MCVVSLRGLGALCVPLPIATNKRPAPCLYRGSQHPWLFSALSFRESYLAEAWFPRRTVVGNTVNKGCRQHPNPSAQAIYDGAYRTAPRPLAGGKNQGITGGWS